MKHHIRIMGWINILLIGVVAAGCGDDGGASGTGSLTVRLESEDVITSGIEAGMGDDNIQDGWDVSFARYLTAVGALDLHLANDESVEVEDEAVFVVDMTDVPPTGLPLWSFDEMPTGTWAFNYATPGAADGAMRHSTVVQADFDEMVANDWTYFIDGTLSNAETGESCPPSALAVPGKSVPNGNMSGTNPCYAAEEIRFTFGASAETDYTRCEFEGVEGFSVSSGSSTSVSMTLHGDHLFFNGFPEGDEGGVMRLAQWLADCDLNLDGVVTEAELTAISPNDLPEIDERYQLGAAEFDNMYEYVIAQLKTQGHFQGEGECEVDGEGHDHEE